MSEYVPDTEFVRGRHRIARGAKPGAECDAEFDRWLERVRAEAKAEALEEAAAEWERLCKIGDSPRNQGTDEEIQEFWSFHAQSTEEWLRACAAQYREGGGDA